MKEPQPTLSFDGTPRVAVLGAVDSPRVKRHAESLLASIKRCELE